MKESAAEPQKIRRKNSVSEVIGRCDSGIGASIRENEEKHMITGEVEAVDRKQKIRDRYKGVDISELEVIPAKIIEDLETSSVIRRVAAYIRVPRIMMNRLLRMNFRKTIIRIIFRHSRDGYLLESMRMRASVAHLWNTEKGCSS